MERVRKGSRGGGGERGWRGLEREAGGGDRGLWGIEGGGLEREAEGGGRGR